MQGRPAASIDQLDETTAHDRLRLVCTFDPDACALVRRVRDRVVKALRRVGKWWDADDCADGGDDLDAEQQPLVALGAGAVTGRAVLGERAGEGDEHVGSGTRAEPFVRKPRS